MLQKFRSPTPSHPTVAAYLSLFLAAALTLFLGLGAPASASVVERDFKRACARYASEGVRVVECAKQLRIARDATAKYRDPTVAMRDGFVKTDDCDGHPGTGAAMGEHWVHVERMSDEKLDPREPEILLYIDTPTGRRLVAVEWSFQRIMRGPPLTGALPYFGTQPPDPDRTTPAPKMFGGKTFDGPMQGHHPHQPWHYDLHVWLWEKNPEGIFAQYNPRLSCKDGAAEDPETTEETPAADSDLPVVDDVVPQTGDVPVAGDLPVVGDVIPDHDDDDHDGDGDGDNGGNREKDRGGLLGGLGL